MCQYAIDASQEVDAFAERDIVSADCLLKIQSERLKAEICYEHTLTGIGGGMISTICPCYHKNESKCKYHRD